MALLLACCLLRKWSLNSVCGLGKFSGSFYSKETIPQDIHPLTDYNHSGHLAERGV